MNNIESVLFDHYADNTGDLFNTSNRYHSPIFGSPNLYSDYNFTQSNYTPRYTHEEYRDKFATAVKFRQIIKKTNRAYLFELARGLGRWVPISSINSIENDTVWIYEQPYLAKPFKLEVTSREIKETQQQEQITLETVNRKLDLILHLLNN